MEMGWVGMGSMLPFRSGWKVKGSGNQGDRCPEPYGGAVEALSSATICLSFPPGFGAPLLSERHVPARLHSHKKPFTMEKSLKIRRPWDGLSLQGSVLGQALRGLWGFIETRRVICCAF